MQERDTQYMDEATTLLAKLADTDNWHLKEVERFVARSLFDVVQTARMDGESFKQRVYRVMEDDDLNSVQKLVMIAHFLYEGNPSASRIAQGASISTEVLRLAERYLMEKDWLAAPSGQGFIFLHEPEGGKHE